MNALHKFSIFLLAIALVMVAACSSSNSSNSMAGFWMDNANNVTEIQEQNGQYVAVTNYYTFAASSQNTLISSSYENGVLTWKYCPPAKVCITMKSVAVHKDTLDVTWTNDNGESGTMTLTRSVKYTGRGNS
jgi:hypothetical protein